MLKKGRACELATWNLNFQPSWNVFYLGCVTADLLEELNFSNFQISSFFFIILENLENVAKSNLKINDENYHKMFRRSWTTIKF